MSEPEAHLILSILVRDRKRATASLDAIRPDHWESLENPLPALVLGLLQEFIRTYRRLPDVRELLGASQRALGARLQGAIPSSTAKIDRYVRSLYEGPIPPSQEIWDRGLDASRRRILADTLAACREDVLAGDGAATLSRVSAAARIGSDPIELYEDSDRDLDRLSQPDSGEDRSSSGSRRLDRSLGGGLPAPGLGIFMSSPKGWKTASLLRATISNVARGWRVAYASIELPIPILMRRLLSMVSGIPIRALNRPSGRIGEARDRWRRLLRLGGGSLRLKLFPTRATTVDHLRLWIDAMAGEGWRADAIVIDYADYLRSGNPNEEERHVQTNVYAALRGFSLEFGIPIWSAALTNRRAIRKSHPAMDDIAEAFAKNAIADLIVAIGQTDLERKGRTGRLYVSGSRISESGFRTPIKFRPKILRWDDDEEAIRREREERRREAAM